MRRKILAIMALTLVGANLAGCGKGQRPQRAAWRDQAEEACAASRQVPSSAYMSLRSQPIQGAGTCGMNRPYSVKAFGNGNIGLTSTATLACPVIATTDRWLSEVVQPAAMNTFGAQVLEMRAGSYSCRTMNNGSGTSRTSEHAYGNALDIFSFRLSDGRNVTVKDGWNGAPEEQSFLREVFVGACERYKTVLGPGADMFHYDHFHVDLARHNGGRSICKPLIKFTPRHDLTPPDPARSWAALPGSQGLPQGSMPVTASQAPSGLTPRGNIGTGPLPRDAYGQTPRTGVPGVGYNTPPALDSMSGQPRGPLQLPGAVPMDEELVIGDVEGNAIMDGQGQPEITPENDPFAVRPKR